MVRIITDSAADFEPWELEERKVTCIPLTVVIGGTEYQENVDLTKAQFYQLLEQTGEAPKTAQPSPQLLTELFAEAAGAGDGAIYIALSSQLSGTYQTAVAAAEMADVRGCYVLDSRNATGGQRMLVELAVEMRDRGCPVEEILEAVTSLRERIVLYACVDTLEYLYRGGRIDRTVYKLGSLAQVKPIIRVHEGRVEAPAKAMGMRKGIDLLCRQTEIQIPDPRYPIYVLYTGDSGNVRSLRQRLEEKGFQIPESRWIGVGAAIGSHVGPGACGIVYVEKE